MHESEYAARALETWAILATKYDEATPTPESLKSGVEIYFNGELNYRSVEEWRLHMSEAQRRFPDWENDIIQEFGDDYEQCIVWHSTANRHLPPDQQLSVHGVTMLESEQGVIKKIKFYYESDTVRTRYGSYLELRVVK